MTLRYPAPSLVLLTLDPIDQIPKHGTNRFGLTCLNRLAIRPGGHYIIRAPAGSSTGIADSVMVDQPETDHFLDITAETCPMTFVKSKLMIERMAVGETASIRLQGEEPLSNVPRSIRDYGHDIISLLPETAHTPRNGIHLIVMRKTN